MKLRLLVMFLGADWQLIAYKALGVALRPATQLSDARASMSTALSTGMAAAWMSGAERRARRGMAEKCIFESVGGELKWKGLMLRWKMLRRYIAKLKIQCK